jgi:hypothetical protein
MRCLLLFEYTKLKYVRHQSRLSPKRIYSSIRAHSRPISHTYAHISCVAVKYNLKSKGHTISRQEPGQGLLDMKAREQCSPNQPTVYTHLKEPVSQSLYLAHKRHVQYCIQCHIRSSLSIEPTPPAALLRMNLRLHQSPTDLLSDGPCWRSRTSRARI